MTRLRDAILVVDDELDFARGLARLIQKGFPSHPVVVKSEGQSSLNFMQERPCALMVTDLRMPGMDGFSLLTQAHVIEPFLSVIVLTGFGTIETAVAALKAGAYDFLTKPIDQDCLYRVVSKGLERTALLRENNRLRHVVATCTPQQTIIGDSAVMRRLREEIEAVAATDYSVLIQGESGSGKEMAARTIHGLSRRAERPLVSVNCTAIPEQILESELFGHLKGAFTGADKTRQGLFMEADGSTLLLDEIGDLPLHLQPKLLRALQEREIRPIGGSQNIPVDVRIIASTNQRMESRINSGSFREDLYYRLNVLAIRLPALRERPQDVPLLAMHFLHQTCRELDTGEKELTRNAMNYLSTRPWPGNVRELLNFIRRLAVFCRGSLITQAQVRLMEASAQGSTPGHPALETYREAKERFMEDFTRSYIHRLLEETTGNISQAARISGLERVSIQKIVRRLGIAAKEFRGKPG
ncbi:MAG: sigma-54 dependent transcriptional regulator [Pseudomonadota bacterium]